MEQIILYLLVFFNLGLIIWLVFLTSKYNEILKKGDLLFSEKTPGNLLEIIQKYLRSVKEVEDHCFSLDNDLKKNQGLAESGYHKLGFLRYNPFGDVGGNQSFSLCLLDGDNSGFVFSSIHSREGTRVYAKTVEKGISEFNLSEEEKKAIGIALKKK